VKLLSTETSGTGAESATDGGSSGDGSKAMTADSIQWLTREQTFVIVYLVRNDSNVVPLLVLVMKGQARGYNMLSKFRQSVW
jgi:hypothetical protein